MEIKARKVGMKLQLKNSVMFINFVRINWIREVVHHDDSKGIRIKYIGDDNWIGILHDEIAENELTKFYEAYDNYLTRY
jgi:hypothetical protein